MAVPVVGIGVVRMAGVQGFMAVAVGMPNAMRSPATSNCQVTGSARKNIENSAPTKGAVEK